MTRTATRTSTLHSERGSVFLTAMIFAVVIAMVLASVLTLTRNTTRVANRFFYDNAVLNLCETGIEQALWSLNAANDGSSTAWSGWTTSSGNASRKFSNFSYNGNTSGYVNVYVYDYQSNATIVAKAIVNLPEGQSVEKWVRVTVGTRSLFAYGLLSRTTIYATGGCVFDSWSSDPDNNDATAAISYSSSVAGSNSKIAAAYAGPSAITLDPSAKVYGAVAVGTDNGSVISYGANLPGVNSTAGLDQDWGTKVGNKDTLPSSSYPYLESGHMATGFTASFETITAPTGASVVSNYSLPYYYDNPATSWNDNQYISSATIGTSGTTTILQMNKLSVSASARLTIAGNVVLILPPSGVTTFEVIAGGSLTLASGATLTIYTPGNIDITGGASAGVVNNMSPESLVVWSTATSASTGQVINLTGSGAFSGVIYAPYATFTLPGGTNYYGAAVVGSASLTGSGSFHYDEALVNYGSSGSKKITSYDELNTPAERITYLSALSF